MEVNKKKRKCCFSRDSEIPLDRGKERAGFCARFISVPLSKGWISLTGISNPVNAEHTRYGKDYC